jgi:sugar phosphate isomerase/epimerase
MKLGIVTYNIAADWDLDTVIATCTELGIEGVELRTTHAHKVEVDLSPAERAEVKRKFADAPVELVGLGSAFDYHAADPAALAKNIEDTREYIALARDVGAQGVKVRPNAFPEGVPREKTIEQIGRSLAHIGAFAQDNGVQIRLEVHGRETCHPPHIRQMLDIADHPNVYACWNSNNADMDESGSIEAHFGLLEDRIALVHINRLFSEYPYQSLFSLLKKSGYAGFCLAEIPGSADPETVLRYYRKLFETMEAHA